MKSGDAVSRVHEQQGGAAKKVAVDAGRKQLGGSRDGACTGQLLNWSGLVLTDWNRIGSIQLPGS